MPKLVPVYKLSVMEELVRMGYHIKSVVDNKNNKNVKVFMFYNKNNILETLNKIK